MPERWKTIKVHLEYPGASPDDFSWPVYKEFMDAFVGALTAMKNGPRATSIRPGDVEDGSAVPVLKVPPEAMPAVKKLRDGPKRSWAAVEREGVEPFYRFLEKKGAKPGLELRKGKVVPFRLPAGAAEQSVLQYEHLEAVVRLVGGKEGRVHLEFDEGVKACDAGKLLAYRLGRLLYHRIRVSGHSRRDPSTSALLDFTIEGFEQVGAEPELDATVEAEGTPLALFNQLAELLDEDLSGRKVDDILSEVR